MKTCTICSKNFNGHNRAKTCSLECRSKLRKQTKEEWKINNKDRVIQQEKDWYSNNSKYKKKKQKKWFNSNKEYVKQREQIRNTTNLNRKLSLRLRTRLWSAIKNNHKTGSAIKDLGCSIEELKGHLEAKFKPGMSWDNWGSFGWHIDHIKPLSSYNLNKSKETKQACHYTNLQPLWWHENLSKGDKYNEKN